MQTNLLKLVDLTRVKFTLIKVHINFLKFLFSFNAFLFYPFFLTNYSATLLLFFNSNHFCFTQHHWMKQKLTHSDFFVSELQIQYTDFYINTRFRFHFIFTFYFAIDFITSIVLSDNPLLCSLSLLKRLILLCIFPP